MVFSPAAVPQRTRSALRQRSSMLVITTAVLGDRFFRVIFAQFRLNEACTLWRWGNVGSIFFLHISFFSVNRREVQEILSWAVAACGISEDSTGAFSFSEPSVEALSPIFEK